MEEKGRKMSKCGFRLSPVIAPHNDLPLALVEIFKGAELLASCEVSYLPAKFAHRKTWSLPKPHITPLG